MKDDGYSKEIESQKVELFKIKKQVADQRREYRKVVTVDARADHLTDKMVEAANSLNKEKPLDFTEYVDGLTKEKAAILCLSDWHYGMTTDNIWNTYNTDICRQRVQDLVVKAKQAIRLHKPDVLHIVILGDMSQGGIHVSARVQSEELVVDQLMHVSEILAEVIDELSFLVNKVNVHSTYGNHMRTIQNKKDSVHADNMESIVPWWLRQRLQKNPKVNIIDSEFKEFIKINIFNYNIVGVHGDLDNFKNLGVTVNTIFSKLYGETIDYTLSGDKHHLEEFDQFGIESILIPSLCGSDDYASDRRLYSNAGQTLMMFDENGRECTYNIRLN